MIRCVEVFRAAKHLETTVNNIHYIEHPLHMKFRALLDLLLKLLKHLLLDRILEKYSYRK